MGTKGVLHNQEIRQRPEQRELDRREFLKGIALLGAFTLLSTSAACKPTAELAPQAPSTNPSAVLPKGGETPVTKVSLVRTPDRISGVTKAIALLQSNPVQGKAVVLSKAQQAFLEGHDPLVIHFFHGSETRRLNEHSNAPVARIH